MFVPPPMMFVVDVSGSGGHRCRLPAVVSGPAAGSDCDRRQPELGTPNAMTSSPVTMTLTTECGCGRAPLLPAVVRARIPQDTAVEDELRFAEHAIITITTAAARRHHNPWPVAVTTRYRPRAMRRNVCNAGFGGCD